MTVDHDAPEIFRALEQSGLLGLIWVDRNLRVSRTVGATFEPISPGTDVTDAIPALVGLEADMLKLESTPDEILDLPAVATKTCPTVQSKINFTIRWDHLSGGILIVAQRSRAQNEIEIELTRQTRARLIAEAELQQTARELERANTDLENFAALISHDLKAPLRHMRTLVDDAFEMLKGQNIDAARDQLMHIREQSTRMSNMLSALFEYSLIGRKYEMVELIDLKELVNSISDQLDRGRIRISIDGTWPTVTTLRAPLTMVISNLMINAIQHHDREDGLIQLTCNDAPESFEMAISDDGPGIAEKHQETVFLPFRSLNSECDRASSGMGLAMVKRTVEAIGGRISLTSKPEQSRGATFHLAWPKKLPLA